MEGLHMIGGEGETSYTKNSTGPRAIILSSIPVIEKAVARLCLNNKTLTSMGIADLGCSTGTNSLMTISDTICMIRSKMCELGIPMPELRISLNDLPTNDFNYVLTTSLPEFYERMRREEGIADNCFVSCVAGSFHGRLFPKNSHHLLLSFSSLHWLSQPPNLNNLNKGKIYISKNSPPCVSKAYHDQFNKDFYSFLRSRAEEIVSGGQMVLTFLGQAPPNFSNQMFFHVTELFAQALVTLASEGLIEEEKIDACNLPLYTPHIDEVKGIVENEGSFSIDYLEEGETYVFKLCDDAFGGKSGKLERGEWFAKQCRGVMESVLEAAFGTQIMDELFRRFGKLVSDILNSEAKYISLIVSLIKN